MPLSQQELDIAVKEIQWVDYNKSPSPKKEASKAATALNYLVSIGVLATTGALSAGLYNFYKRNSKKQQYYMRCRVLGQGITLLLASAGLLFINK